MLKKVWLTKLEHFGGYEISVITETREEGIKIIRSEFNKANRQRGLNDRSSYVFKELLDGGDVQQFEFLLREPKWL